MIKSFRHKGLQKCYQSGSKAGIQAKHAGKIRLILARLDAAQDPKDMNLPGLRLHQLGGEFSSFYADDVSGNWRIVFRFRTRMCTMLTILTTIEKGECHDA